MQQISIRIDVMYYKYIKYNKNIFYERKTSAKKKNNTRCKI